MFDEKIINFFDKPRTSIARRLLKLSLLPDHISLIGLFFSFVSGLLIIFNQNYAAIFFILLSRLCDGLDGALAKVSKQLLSKHGGFVDAVCDLFFYGFIVLSFALSSDDRILPSLLILFSFYLTTGSFYAYSASAAKTKIKNSSVFGYKKLIYDRALIEGFETILFFILLLLFPEFFSIIAYIFFTLCIASFALRVYFGLNNLKNS